MTVVTIPDPGIVVLVGAAGSGKSTLAARHFAADEILSSDAFRATIAGDERDQRATGAAFRAVDRALERRLVAGQLTVIDATNVTRRDRRSWVLAAGRHGMPLVAIVLDLPGQTIHAQDAGRDRVVGSDVVGRHLERLRRTVDLDELRDEGFDLVITLRSSAEVRALAMKRRSTHPSESTAGSVATEEG
ncbi:MAG: AAA family ATPase [Candidatus Limnocylindrales bacterium]